MTEKTFKINSRKDLEFKGDKITAIDLLSLKNCINMKSFAQNQTMFKFILEHTLVKIKNNWVRVKEIDRDVYMPLDLENDLGALEEITFAFIDNILLPFFKNSNE